MLRALDHVVVAVADLDAARTGWEALGFTVVPGGRHPPPAGTHNALVALADGTYFELIAFYEPTPAHRWWEPLRRGGGLVDLCAASDDLEGDAERWRRAGVAVTGPIARTRLRPDGVEVRWQLVMPAAGHRGLVPFLIRDETPRTVRVPAETGHPNGATGLAGVTLVAPDPTAVAALLEAAGARGGEPIRDPGLGGAGVRVHVGPHRVDVLRPAAPGSPLAEWLTARGPSPFAVTLAHAGGRSGILDPARAAGARLTWA
ncbi:MAG TPA: VOC family protein [Methylomirabilota bacterium]|nr:VOC family protein [Methylomirabilota bacterium]